MFKRFLLISTFFSSVFCMAGKPVYITLDKDALQTAQKKISHFEIVEVKGKIAIAKIDSESVEQTSSMMHDHFNRCGGFVSHESLEEASRFLNNDQERTFAKNVKLIDYSMTASSLVANALEKVQDLRIEQDIIHLSSYKNRHYKKKLVTTLKSGFLISGKS